MALFGTSIEEEVNQALEKIRGRFPKAKIAASVDGKNVTLRGEAPDMETKTKIMKEFNALVKTDNTMNQISVASGPQAGAPQPKAAGANPMAPPPAGTAQMRIHEVVKGETLSAIAKKYYGNANTYPKIFEANRDILTDPDKIKVGQKLKIPE